MCNIVCPYKCKCTSYPGKCNNCRRNTGKRDYYIPGRCYDWYSPYRTTWNPYSTWQYTWSTAGNYTISGNDNTQTTWTIT